MKISQTLLKDTMAYKDEHSKREYHKKWYREHPERKAQLQEYNKIYSARNAKLVRRYKLKCGCYICGYNKSEYALDFHHLHETDKSHNISNMIKKSSLKRLKAEIRKCVVLCANCHREITFGPYSLYSKIPVL